MPSIKHIVYSMIAMAPLLAATRGQAQQPGLALAEQVCVVCHAIYKRPGSSPNPAAPRFEEIANVPGMTALALSVALRTSHSTMPNLILDKDEVESIAAYILSLK
jgi:mono/diheme cytochrome c family protein